MMAFYVGVLGFGLSDYIEKPFRAYFFHVNARHHSLALIETGKNGMHHLMVELCSLDDVGQCYDIAQMEEGRVSVTLGRHTNDFMTSFYAKTPSSFMIECGWGGREIDPATWQPVEMHDGPSLWGHERVWLPPEDRVVAREMRMRAASSGLRAPAQAMEGNDRPTSGTCARRDGRAREADYKKKNVESSAAAIMRRCRTMTNHCCDAVETRGTSSERMEDNANLVLAAQGRHAEPASRPVPRTDRRTARGRARTRWPSATAETSGNVSAARGAYPSPQAQLPPESAEQSSATSCRAGPGRILQHATRRALGTKH